MSIVTIEKGTQRVMRIIATQLGILLPDLKVVQSQALFEPQEKDLPLLRLAWRERSRRLLTRLEYPASCTAVATDFRFTPKAAGECDNNGQEPDVLYDADADFSYVINGDKVRNLTRGTIGTVTQAISRTNLRCKNVMFISGDKYDIHWAIDVEKNYTADREAVLVFDLYAKADVEYGTAGLSLDELERALVGHIWTTIREALQNEYVEVVEFERVTDASGIIASGLGADWYDRATLELSIVIGDGMAVRKPTVESVPIPATPRYTAEEAAAGKSGFVVE